jgi:prepilin-type N-terminal cleavage/methylation domain-containing protein
MKATRGFTLLELLVTIAVLGVVTAMAIPAFGSLAEKWRVKGAAEYVYEQLMFARTEAVKRSRPIIVAFSAADTDQWSLGITDRNFVGAVGCNPAKTAITDAEACTIDYDNNLATDTDAVLYRFASTPFREVRMKGEAGNAPAFTGTVGECLVTGSNAQTCFDPMRGMARRGTIVLGTDRHEAWVQVNPMGRARICAPDNERGIGDYPPCPEEDE